MAMVYYSDGTVYEGNSPPSLDVQVIVQEHPDIGWHTQSGSDFYVWDDGRWVGVFDFGLFQYLELQGMLRSSSGNEYTVLVDGEWRFLNSGAFYFWLKGTGKVLFGRTLTQAKFNEVMRLALNDLDGQKKCWTRDERRIDG
jgi:hypothetical protein